MMITIIILVLIAVAAMIGPQFITTNDPAKQTSVKTLRQAVRIIGVLILVFAISSTSFVFVGADETGHRMKIYLGGDLKDGAIVAAHGEKGPQAEIMPPGFHFEPLLNVLYEISMQGVIRIPEGHYGFLVARDGKPLRPVQTYADEFAPEDAANMINNTSYFLTHGGQKGPQTSVLTPGTYRLNMFLWDVKVAAVTDILKGFVGVIKSNVHSQVNFANLRSAKPTDCSPTSQRKAGDEELAVPLVPVGCIGIWNKALSPGKYYINREAYDVTLVDTRVQTWEYKGGYRKRSIDLKVSQKGEIEQTERTEEIAVPKTAIDQAIFVKVEGWDIPVELRALVQIAPQNAPFVVASVGGLEEVQSRVLTPAIRSVLRNVLGGSIHVPTATLDTTGKPIIDSLGRPMLKTITRSTLVMDLIENRDFLEQNIEQLIRPEGIKAGVDIKEVRLGDPLIPPEILVARQREQLADQLRKAFMQERRAQSERIATEQAKATADQQHNLVEAQIEVQRTERLAVARRNEGRGERDKLNLIAEGQSAQAGVLGKDRVVELRKFELVVGRAFDFFEGHPDVLTTALGNAQKFVPERVFTMGGGGGNSLAGAAAILGDLLSGEKKKVSKDVKRQE